MVKPLALPFIFKNVCIIKEKPLWKQGLLKLNRLLYEIL